MRYTLKTALCLCMIIGLAVSLRASVHFDFVPETSLIVVPVTINGQGPYRFLLDTGANNTVLSAAIADSLAIPVARRGTLLTAGGSIDVAIRALKTLNVGASQLKNLEIAVGNFDLMKKLKVDGVLGADYLRQFTVAIDYDCKLVKIEPRG